MVAYDDGTPSLENETTVVIYVERNLFPPTFVNPVNQNVRIPETTDYGTIIATVTARDPDLVVRSFVTVLLHL